MVNCAHPEQFDHLLGRDEDWISRVRGVGANASRTSHAEFDKPETLDAGDPSEPGVQYGALRGAIPNLNVIGGCCDTDQRISGKSPTTPAPKAFRDRLETHVDFETSATSMMFRAFLDNPVRQVFGERFGPLPA